MCTWFTSTGDTVYERHGLLGLFSLSWGHYAAISSIRCSTAIVTVVQVLVGADMQSPGQLTVKNPQST